MMTANEGRLENRTAQVKETEAGAVRQGVIRPDLPDELKLAKIAAARDCEGVHPMVAWGLGCESGNLGESLKSTTVIWQQAVAGVFFSFFFWCVYQTIKKLIQQLINYYDFTWKYQSIKSPCSPPVSWQQAVAGNFFLLFWCIYQMLKKLIQQSIHSVNFASKNQYQISTFVNVMSTFVNVMSHLLM
jgi:hypothetical protein